MIGTFINTATVVIGTGVGLTARRFSHEGGSTFSQAFVSTSILFCVGPMTIMGCIQDGLRGDYSLLLVKSLLDGVSAAFFTAALGGGVLFSAGTVLVVQGALTLGAGWVGSVLTEPMKNTMFSTGGLMMLGLGIRLLNLRQIPVANFLPALVVAPLLVWLVSLWR
jgi:hypothetical protein